MIAKNAYNMAKEWYGDESPANAVKAARRMKSEGWAFAGYDGFGEETYEPTRPCTCGSGVHWSECRVGTQFCG